jgi:CelD/BcsL family acetyltransferase involved in cellulose biosynthesis
MELKLHSEFPLEMEDEWNALLEQSSSHVPFLRYDYLSEWWSTRGGGEWPDDARLAIITAREGGRLVGIAPFFVTRVEDVNKLYFLGSIEISDYLDVICREEDLAAFIRAVLVYLRDELKPQESISEIDLYNILESSPSIQLLKETAKDLDLDVDIDRLQHSPYIPLPGDWEEYLATIDKKQRHEIRRKMRRAAEGEVIFSLYITSEASKLEDDIEDFLDLMAQDEVKDDFLSPRMRDQMASVMRCAFDHHCLQLAFLTIAEKKVAGYLSFDYLNRIWVYNSGIDKMYSSYSPGWVLLGHLLQWANEHGRQEFDFMRGDEEYKYKFGAIDRYITRIRIELD